MKEILVFGGGRWSRQIIQELLLILNKNFNITIISPRNFENMIEWSKRELETDRVIIKKSFLPNEKKYIASIIANSVTDHYLSAKISLENYIPTIIEKPVTNSSYQTKQLIEFAHQQLTILCSANVFLYSNNIELFSKYISKKDKIDNFEFIWTDPQNETRYGEIKKSDTSISVYANYLPHVISICKILFATDQFAIKNIKMLENNNQAIIEVKINNIICLIKLNRNGNKRQRIIKMKSQNDEIRFDFTDETPKLFINNIKDINYEFDKNDRPLSKMLGTFLKSAETSCYESNLDINFGLKINEIINELDNLTKNVS